MSKLDRLISDFKDKALPAEGVHLHKEEDVKGFKAEIKALMRELIGYGSVDMEYDMEKLSLTEKAELVGRNQLTRELRQKIEEL